MDLPFLAFITQTLVLTESLIPPPRGRYHSIEAFDYSDVEELKPENRRLGIRIVEPDADVILFFDDADFGLSARALAAAIFAEWQRSKEPTPIT